MRGLFSTLRDRIRLQSHRLCDGFFRLFQANPSPESLGPKGERLAAKYLRGLGYRILARSYRSMRSEIDIIALDGKTIVFVEVKTWSRAGEGGPSDAVDREKQLRLTRAALVYLKKHRLLEYRARFDVIEVTAPISANASISQPNIRHFRNAFEAVGEYQMFA